MKRIFRRSKLSQAGFTAPQEASPDQTRPPQKVDSILSKHPTVSSFPDGVRLLHDSTDATIDICFVHGLTGDRDSTWTVDGQSTPWPKTLLPSKLPQARILTYGYDAYVTRKSVASSNRLIDHATNLLSDLTTDRDCCNASSRPLIFVAHSLGGLVCKKAILLSRNNPEPHLRGIFNSIKGVIFMGTPHKGAWMADWAKIPASVLGLVKSTNVMLLDILERDNQLLESIQVDFLAMVRQLREEGRGLEITCFFEELPMLMTGQVVSKESATLEGYTPLSIHANHRNMVKFGSTEENGFRRLLGELNRWMSQVVRNPPMIVPRQMDRYRLDAEDRACLQDLQTTNPRDDKDRIETVKGGLLKDSYRWVLDNDDFKQWRHNQHSRLLWIKGDPGKGKTMLLCGIIDELIESAPDTTVVSFFFCQATDVRINNATAVLRGLIYLLIDQHPSFISYVRREYDHMGKQLFEDVNAWEALSKVFAGILEDPLLQTTYLIVDALDECTVGLTLLLDLVAQKSSRYPHVKWIVSSRNWPNIEERLNAATQKVRLWLELNEESVSEAVTIYIQHKVHRLTELKNYNNEIGDVVCRHLLSSAQGTFLWVALVCQELAKIPRWSTLQKLTIFPPGLDALYERMMEQIDSSEDARLCIRILGIVSTVYRPITLNELTSFVDMPDGVSDDYESLAEIIGLCGSFLTLRERTIFFVHQSAKDFLLKKVSERIFRLEIEDAHYAIFSRSLQVMFKTLRRDIYNIKAPGFPIGQVRQPDTDPLAPARYSCVYWVDHLQDCDSRENTNDDLQDGGSVDMFLQQRYLHWLEALSLLGSMSEGIAAVLKLDSLIQKLRKSQALVNRVQDASRFIRYHKLAIENSPLQVYTSALIFSPARSITRECFRNEEPGWVIMKTAIEDNWSSCLQTLEGHSDTVQSVAWSHDGTRLASASRDNLVKIWDAATGQCTSTLERHSDSVWSVAWSHNGTRLISASSDKTVKIWDAATGQCMSTLEGHSGGVWSIAWSHDGTQLASASFDKTVKIWDAGAGQCISTLEGHSSGVWSIAWSYNGTRLASASFDKTVKVWDAATGQCMLTLEGHSSRVLSVAWSHDGTRLASSSFDKTVKIWDASTGQCISTLEGHSGGVWSIDWSHDGTRLASASLDKTVKIWDATTRQCTSTIKGHSDWVWSVAWTYDGTRLVSASSDKTLKIWDAATSQDISTLEGHSDTVQSVAWSHDRTRFTSASRDNTIKIWDASTGQYISTIKGHRDWVSSVAWSHDGTRLISASSDKTVKIWDAATGQGILTLEGHSSGVKSVAWSHNGTRLASASDDKTVRIWDSATGQYLSTLKGHSDSVWSVAWSHDGTRLASASLDKTVKVWDVATGQGILTLEGHSSGVKSVAWSHNGTRLASASDDKTVRIWDSATEQCISTLDIGFPGNLQFDEFNNHLHTGIGTFDLQPTVPKTVLATTIPGRFASSPQQVGHGLKNDGAWITYKSENLLWLPPEYRPESPSSSVIFGTTVTIGCCSGRVLTLTFSKVKPVP